MKHLMMAAAVVFCFAGCASYEGRPGDDSNVEAAETVDAAEMETQAERDRRVQNKASDNLQDISRQGSPSAPFSRGNGSLNF